MQVVILDGHPDDGRLLSALLDHYQASLPPEAEVRRFCLRAMTFDPHLHRGYSAPQPWEPDLEAFARAVDACDHLVIGFPMWWGGEPARVKGLIERWLLPGHAFRYHRDDQWWDRLMTGRSADLIVTMDTPPLYLSLLYGNPLGRRWRRQILSFTGFNPVRVFRFGPTRRGEAQKRLSRWQASLSRAAAGIAGLRRGDRTTAMAARTGFPQTSGDSRGIL